MSSLHLFTTDSGAKLFAGLDWRVLPNNVENDKALREVARDKNTKFAVKLISQQEEDVTVRGKTKRVKRATAGLWNEGVNEAKPPRKAHSFAASFALAALAQQHENAILVVSSLDAPFEGKTLVVVVVNGVPVVDKISDSVDDAHAIVTSYTSQTNSFQIFTDDNVRYPASLYSNALIREIAEFTSKKTLLSGIPVDLIWWFVVGTVICALITGYYFYDKEKKRKAAAIAEAARIAADPIPKYLAALAIAKQKAGASTQSMVESYNEAMRIGSAFNGWSVKRAGCKLNATCQVDLIRSTGTFSALEKEAKSLALNIKQDTTNLGEAMLYWDHKLAPQKLHEKLPNITDFVKGASGSLLQNWQTAKVNVAITPAQLWPQAAGVPAQFKHPQALKSGKAEVTGIKLPQMIEVMAKQPENIVWDTWTVDVSATGVLQDVLGAATGTIKGNYYVKQ